MIGYVLNQSLRTQIEVGEVKYNFGLFWKNTEMKHIYFFLLLPPGSPVDEKSIEMVLFESNRQMFFKNKYGKNIQNIFNDSMVFGFPYANIFLIIEENGLAGWKAWENNC